MSVNSKGDALERLGWIVALIGAILIGNCEARAQSISHYDSSRLARIQMLPPAGNVLREVFNASNNVRQEMAGCLYGKVEGDTLFIYTATPRTVVVADSVSIRGMEPCGRKHAGLPYVGMMHTHIVGSVLTRAGFSNVDNRRFWRDRRAVVDLIAWGVDETSLFMTYNLRSSTGIWRWGTSETFGI